MKDHKDMFSSFAEKLWLNAASEGPLPLRSAKALQEAIEWKSKPYLLDIQKFAAVPNELKKSISRLIGVAAKDVILGNSASYGLHILSNGIEWEKGDEILLMQNDFPTNILPWLALEKKGVKVKQVPAKNKVFTVQEFISNISPRTKLFCISHVHTFSGIVLDIEAMAKVCRAKNIICVVNISQSAGTMPIDVSSWAADAVVCAGYKWLCGPYGTGFCWIKPELRESLTLNQAYWIPCSTEEELKSEGPIALKELHTARKYDVFGTANFFNFVPFKASIDLWLEIGLDKVQEYHNHLIERFIKGLGKQYILVSPARGRERSSLVVISHNDKIKNEAIYQQLVQKGIYTALWKGNIRVSPHVYNTEEDVDRILKELKQH